MRTLVSALLFLFATGLIEAQTNVSGNITKDSTWSLAGSPYKVIGSFHVNSGFTLKVDSGVVVRFQSNLYMYVEGTLRARQATFTSSKDTAGGTPLKGDWGSIQINTTGATMVLDTCVVKFGGNGVPMVYAPSRASSVALTNCSFLNSGQWGVNLNASGSLTMTNCTVSNSGYSGVYLDAPTMTVTGGTISSSAGLGLQLNEGTNATVSNLIITSSTNGQGLWVSSTNSNVSNCSITGSNSNGLQINAGTNAIVHKTTVSTSNGVGLYLNVGSSKVDSCTISASTGHGIQVIGADSLLVCSVTNSNGQGIYIQGGSLVLIGCTVTTTPNQGLYFEQNTSITVTNSSITGSQWPLYSNGQASIVFNGANTLTGNTHNGIYMNYSGTNANLVLDTVYIPYVFPYDFTVNSGNTMTIASTDVLKFNGGHLYVNGSFNAIAAPGQGIYFTSYHDDNLPTPGSDTNADGTGTSPHTGDWYGIVFNDQSIDSACVMRRCVVYFAGGGNTGGISMYNASPTIDSCNIAYNYYGAMMQYVSNPMFTNNTIGSSQMVPIAMAFTANPVFSNNIFSNSDNTYDAIGLLGGTLTANAVLPIRSVLRNNTKSALGALGVDTISNVVYMLLDQVIIPPGLTMTINKGIVIKGFSSGQRIAVQGKLIASATPDSMIVMTSASDDNFGHPNDTNKNGNATSPARGDWGGIQFESGSDSTSILNNCSIHYGQLGYPVYYNYYYGQIYLNGGAITTINLANPTISNCIIDQCTYGVYAYGNSRPQILNTKIVNTQSTPIAMSVPADPFFSADTFVNPGLAAIGIIGEYLGASGTIRQRTVSGYNNITYVLLDNLHINSGTNVFINGGVVIKTGGAGFYVSGGLRAKGTIANGNVIFTSIKDDNFGNPGDSNRDGNASSPAAGDWSTIQFLSTSDDTLSLIDSCQINYAGSSSFGGVTYTDAGSTISNSTIFKSAAFGIRCENSSTPTVTNVTLNGCNSDPIAMSLHSNPTFSNISFSANGSNGIRLLDNTLSSNATLAQRSIAGFTNIGYILDGLTINAGAVLTINPGVVIKFSGYYSSIAVNGALVANGTQSQKITFTSLSDDSRGGDTNNNGNASSPSKSNWSTIDFYSSSSDSLNSLRNCEFSYGGGQNYSNEYGMVRSYNSKFVMDSCVISQSGTSGIGAFGSGHPIVTNTQINNVSLTPVTISMFSTPVFTNISSLNLGYMAIGIKPETYSITATIPVRNFGGYTNITYLLYGTITVNSGTTITIPAGVVFKDGNWVVNGALATSGTPSQPVVFTDSRDDGFGNPGDTNQDGSLSSPSVQGFQRVTFNDVSIDSLSIIKNALFRFTDGGIYLVQASPKILDCTFDRDNWGVYLTGVSNPAIDSCLFRNLSNAAIVTSLVSYPTSTLADSISGTTFKAIAILSETLVQDVTLAKRNFAGITNIPYLFSNYTVANNAILTIKPGVILKFYPGTGLTINKGLIAVGNIQPDSAIVFTDLRDDFYGNDTNSDSTLSSPTVFTYPQYWYPGWNGISFTNSTLAPDCILQNVIIRFAGLQNSGAAITLNGASPTITYSSLTNGYNAIVANGSSNPVINYCDIAQNSGWGVNNVGQAFNINAQNNWWGSNTGPTVASNPGGTGQSVSATNVNYLPFSNTGALNPIAGDVSLNGQVQAYDASLILQWLVNSIANPLTTIQQQVADVSGNGSVTAFDASLILQYVVGQVGTFPVDYQRKAAPSMGLFKSATIASASISTGNVDRGSNVTVTISGTGLKNVFGADIALSYNAAELTPVSVTTTGLASGATMMSSMHDGVIRIELAATNALNADGPLFQLTFQAADDVKGHVQSSIAFSKFDINEMDMKAQTSSGVINITGKPTSFGLDQNYPNPFNPSTTISYQVPEDGQQVKIVVYNMTGQLVRTLVDANQRAGEYKVLWDGKNDYGQQVSTGLYFFRMRASNFVSVKKMLLVK